MADTTASSGPQSSGGDPSRWFRLPNTIKPSHYDLTIKSDLAALRFSGCVTISLDILEDAQEIVFNAGPGLVLSQARVQSANLKTDDTCLSTLTIDAKHERATAKLAAPLKQGSKATLTVAFTGEMDNSMAGYVSVLPYSLPLPLSR